MRLMWMLLNPISSSLILRQGSGLKNGVELIETSLRVGEGLAGRAALELHPVVEGDLASSADTGMLAPMA